MSKKKVGIVGYGNMGSAIAEGIKGDYSVLVFDKDAGKTAPARGMKTARSLEELLGGSDIVVLAIKPQELGEVLERAKDGFVGKLVVSIAAGIPTSLLEERLGGGCRVVRAMPNLPAKIGKGMVCFCAGKNAGEDDLTDSAGIFSFIGRVMRVDESMMDAVTAVSGSGPGYLYFLLEQARKKNGLPSLPGVSPRSCLPRRRAQVSARKKPRSWPPPPRRAVWLCWQVPGCPRKFYARRWPPREGLPKPG